jgi:hypothetical protein
MLNISKLFVGRECLVSKKQTETKIAERNSRPYTIVHANWGLTVHFSKPNKKTGRRTITTVLD